MRRSRQQVYRKRGSLTCYGLYTDISPLPGNDLLRQIQPQSDALLRRCGLAAPETLEHLIALLFRNAHTGIRNIHTGIELPWTDADPDTAACRRVLDRVIQNIAQCLRRPPGVMPGRDAVVAFHRQLNLLHLCPGPDRIQRLRDRVIQACALYMQGKRSCLQPRHLDQGLQQKVQLVDLTGHRVHELPALPGA